MLRNALLRLYDNGWYVKVSLAQAVVLLKSQANNHKFYCHSYQQFQRCSIITQRNESTKHTSKIYENVKETITVNVDHHFMGVTGIQPGC